MIFKQITLHNFGVYLGRQTVELAPPSKNKPIVLIGGLNGGGKTTLLDALQLVLFGNMANCSNRGLLGYEAFLKNCIHRSIDQKEGAVIELQFKSTHLGNERLYQVNRSWYQNGSKIREKLEVLCDGILDKVMTETWEDHVENFLPNNISQLFFFDGEKIEDLADLNKSSAVLSTGIQSLLGLDIIDRLVTDLSVLKKKKQVVLKNKNELEIINLKKHELDQLEESREDFNHLVAQAKTVRDRHKDKLNEIERQFKAEGGQLFEMREEIEENRKTVHERLNEVKLGLIEVASGIAPLLLVHNKLHAIERQAHDEEEAKKAEVLNDILTERDNRLLKKIKKFKNSNMLYNEIDYFMKSDRNKYTAKAKHEIFLNLSQICHRNIYQLKEVQLEETASRIKHLVEQDEKLQSEIIEIDRKLARIPDEDSVAELIKEREKMQLQAEKDQMKVNSLTEQWENTCIKCKRKKGELDKVIEANIKESFEQEDTARVIIYSDRVQDTAIKFRKAVIEHHIKRIQKYVMDSFKKLFRKKTLITDIKIDPDNYSLILYGAKGKKLPPDRLSAGERQLLAVSLLWGLASAAERSIPAVIDTPLGRLDSSHRSHIVERYFPKASNQVILLSTDEEIVGKYLKKINKWVGHKYILEFDDKKDATTVNKGYFK